MPISFNQATLVGNLGRDPELRYTAQGTPVGSFSIAVANRKKVDGEWKDETLWVKCTLWNKNAENANQYLQKGRPVLVTGRIGLESWTDKDGKPRTNLVLDVERFAFLGGNDRAEGGAPPKASKPQQPSVEPDIFDEDIPF